MQETDSTKKITYLLFELKQCGEKDQKQKIEEMNGIIDEMDRNAIHWTFTKNLFLRNFFQLVCLALKATLNKQEDKKTQKEVEIALLSLSCLRKGNEIKKKKYLEKITEIIKCHQEHRNLTQLAYQSAWNLLITENSFD
ncbi:uncharacterized protein MONOS_17352 [Monocercomonoides exilis]|uniref:uncharacterized protein n=1 Tax=Monocercomonoides exilis TaxID=2049356 RepID=UPI00355A4731|nr:hypothetical protein MONOS_17352 [Monocercomonoides exilis]